MMSASGLQYGKENKLNSENEMFVTFTIDNEIFGVDVSRVQEIIGIIPIAAIPNSADYLRGVINLRGKVVPVIDIRAKFKIDLRDYDATTVILIIEVNDNSIGFIVDSVSDVIDIPSDLIHDYCQADLKMKSNTIMAIASYNDSLIQILDIDRLLDHEEVSALDAYRD